MSTHSCRYPLIYPRITVYLNLCTALYIYVQKGQGPSISMVYWFLAKAVLKDVRKNQRRAELRRTPQPHPPAPAAPARAVDTRRVASFGGGGGEPVCAVLGAET